MSDFNNPYVRKPAIRWVAGTPLPDMEGQGVAAPLLVDATTGALLVSGGGGGGGSTDMGPTNAKLDTLIGIETTEAADIALTKSEAIAIDAKIPSLSSGRIPVESNNAASQVYNYTATGAVASGTVLIAPIDCERFKEISVHATSMGTNSQCAVQISNDGSTWVAAAFLRSDFNISTVAINNSAIYNYQLLGARFFRIIQQVTQTAGTTTLVAYASQQATPKLYMSTAVTGTVTTLLGPQGTSGGFQNLHSAVSAASTNATLVRTNAAIVGTLVLYNSSSALKWFRLFSKATAPTVGTDTPVLSFAIPPNSAIDISTGYAGMRITTGLAYAITGGTSTALPTDSTAVAAGDVTVNLTYI